MKRILTLIGERGTGEKIVRYKDYEFYHANICYEKFVRYKNDNEVDILINKELVEKAIELIQKFDVVMTEDPDALILQFIIEKRRLNPKPFIIVLIDELIRTKNVNMWIKKIYNENPLEKYFKNPLNYFIFTTKSQYKSYTNSGIQEKNLTYFPTSTFLFETLFPRLKKYFNYKGNKKLSTELKSMYGKIISPGSNNRDYETLIKAFRNLPIEAHIICDLKRYNPIYEKNIYWHSFLPFNEFILAIKSSKYIIISTKKDNEKLGGGQATIVIAQRLGKTIIATYDKSNREYIKNNVTGILIEPNNLIAIINAINYLEKKPEKIKLLGNNAKGFEKKCSKIAKEKFNILLEKVISLN